MQFLGDVHGEGNQPCPAPRPHQWRQKRRRATCTSASAALPSSMAPATTATSGTLLALLLSCLRSERSRTTLPVAGWLSWRPRCPIRCCGTGRGGTGSACCVSGTGFMLVRGVVRVACGSKGRAARCVEQRRCPPGSDEGAALLRLTHKALDPQPDHNVHLRAAVSAVSGCGRKPFLTTPTLCP